MYVSADLKPAQPLLGAKLNKNAKKTKVNLKEIRLTHRKLMIYNFISLKEHSVSVYKCTFAWRFLRLEV